MKKVLSTAALLAAVSDVSAQLVYEPFNYTYVASPQSILDAQANPGNALAWSKMSASPETDDDILITNSNLGIAGLAASSGNSVTFGGAGASERLGLGQEFTSGTMYYALVLEVTSALTTTPAFVAGFSNGSGTGGAQPQSVGTRLYLKQGPNSTPGVPTFSIGVSKNSATASDIVYDGEFALNTPVHVVGSYKINGTAFGTDDESKLWVNPLSSDFGAGVPPAATLTAPLAGTDLPGSTGTTGLAGFVLRQGSSAVPGLHVDELRVDRAWAQVTPPTGISWNVDASGSWSEDAKWSTGVRPNAAVAFVNFGPVATGAKAINVDGSYALRTINFTGNGPYTLKGVGTLNFSGSAAVNVMSGSHTISAAVALGGDFEASVRSGSTLTINAVTSNGNLLLKAGAGTLQLSNLRYGNVELVGGTIRVSQSGSSANVGKIAAINLGPAATLDLINNDLVVDYPAGQSPLGAWNGSAYTGLLGAIQSGRNGGGWNGAGIVTTLTAATGPAPKTTLGIAEASGALGLSGGATAMWRGQSVDASSLLIKYTYLGDANLDGTINADDYFVIDRNYNKSGSVFGYGNGDFNYDGLINSDDYFAIDSTFASQGAPISPIVAAVPEPASTLAVTALMSGAALRRRRR